VTRSMITPESTVDSGVKSGAVGSLHLRVAPEIIRSELTRGNGCFCKITPGAPERCPERWTPPLRRSGGVLTPGAGGVPGATGAVRSRSR
jgi:hypothetical protein